MKVTRVETISVKIPFNEPLHVWRGDLKYSSHVIVRLHTDEGIEGIGEAATMPYYVDESQIESISVIREQLSPMVVDEDPFDLEKICRRMNLVLGHHCSKSAIEIALWDIIGKAIQRPVYKLIGGRYHDRIPLVWILNPDIPSRMVEEAVAAVEKGFKTIKLKVGTDLEEDISNVAAVRDAVGHKIRIRFDFEERCTPKSAISTIRKMERYELELASQPVPFWDLDGMAMVRRSVETPILADECIFSAEDVFNVIKREAADMINIKVMKVGGLGESKKMVAISESADIPCLVGSLFEMGPGTLAGVHFYTSSANINVASEIVGIILMKDDILSQPLKVKDGCIDVPEEPGLGIELNTDKLEKYSEKI